MSFSKAKIIRFNDVSAKCASTGSSNPTTTKEFKPSEKARKGPNSTGHQSPDTSEHGSVKSAPGNFKTPTLPKKTKTATSVTKVKPKDLFKSDLEALKEKTEECEKKTKYIHQLTEELEQCQKDLKEVRQEKEQMQREHQNELQNLEVEILQTMTKLQKQEEDAAMKLKEVEDKLASEIEKMKKAHEYHIGQVILDYEIKIKDLNELSDGVLKDKVEELENKWKETLQQKEAEHEAILKECQAISEYSIITCELEKNQIKKSLEETKATYEDLAQKYEGLKCRQGIIDKDLESKEGELKRKVSGLKAVIRKQEEEIQKLNVEIKAYQITISNSQITIDVLKKRLIDSDRDVEQLKQELTSCEERLIDYEGRCMQLNSALSEAKKENEDLELQYESSIKLNEDSIKLMRQQLFSKVGLYENQVKSYSEKVTEDQELKQQILEQLNSNIEVIKQINLEVEKTEEYYALKTKDLEEIIEDYKVKEKSWSDKVQTLNIENEQVKETLKEKDQKIELLEEKLQELEGNNADLSEKYLYYKAKAEEYELEAKESSQTRKKYIDISGKYDCLIQDFEQLEMENLDQKSKLLAMSTKMDRLLGIQEEFEKLKKEKEMLESENTFYKTKLDEHKLKKYHLAAKDKENIGSPNRSLIESPNRSSPFRGSPFRERNN